MFTNHNVQWFAVGNCSDTRSKTFIYSYDKYASKYKIIPDTGVKVASLVLTLKEKQCKFVLKNEKKKQTNK